MARINLERFLKEAEDNSDERYPGEGRFMGAFYVQNGSVSVNLGTIDHQEHPTFLSLRDALIVFAVRRGLTKKPEFIDKTKQMVEDFMSYALEYAYAYGQFRIPQLIKLAKSLHHPQLAEIVYLSHLDKLVKDGGYGYLSAGEFSSEVGKHRDSRIFYRKALEITDEPIYFSDLIQHARETKNSLLLRQVWNKRIRGELKAKSFVLARNHSLDAEKDAREIGADKIADYFHQKAERYNKIAK